MTWMELSAVSAACAFIVLVVFTVRLLIAVKHSLRQMNEAIALTSHSVVQTAKMTEQLLERVEGLTEDVHTQVRVLEPCFHSVEQAGAAIGDVASVLRKAAKVLHQSIQGAEKTVHTHQKRLQDAMEWATTGFELWQRWQAHKNAKSDTKGSD
ncbi:DUF948 domain-containing protein [Paenibacillus sp. SI8]|uniref:DUF948 domain-containing protein n=1 Tax=unclassified Paenibacillus TaxID=185978 RepID=UPI003465F48C